MNVPEPIDEITIARREAAEDSMSEAEAEYRELQDERGAELGDPRRCPKHGCAISSPDGLFDAPCGACENEMEVAYEAEMAAHFYENLNEAKNALKAKHFNDARWFVNRANVGAVSDGQRRLVDALSRTLSRIDPVR